MFPVLFLLLFARHFVVHTSAEIEKHYKTIHGNPDADYGLDRTRLFEASDAHLVNRRDTSSTSSASSAASSPAASTADTRSTANDTVLTKITPLQDGHKQLMVHWVGAKSDVIICLAKDPAPFSLLTAPPKVSPSAVYISYDYGDSFVNKTDSFQLKDKSYATLDKFYNHNNFTTHLVFTDVRHNAIFVTKNHGKSIKRIDLNFSPSELVFVDSDASTFVVLDKNDTNHKLYITDNFGTTFRQAHEYVKTFHHLKEQNVLLVQRFEPNGLSTIMYSRNLFSSRTAQPYATDVKDFFLKGDYLFSTKKGKLGLDLFVSYKLGKQQLCVFDTELPLNNFFIVDVTANRALISVSHNETTSHLYVSEDLNQKQGSVHFVLSLDNVFAHFPNITWQDSWLQQSSEEAFTDIYKVEGLQGIYIASKVTDKPTYVHNLGPQHLSSMITFDHGASWRLITPPTLDVDNQATGCEPTRNCSLHLNQKFSQLHPDTRATGVLSSKSAPGILIATGVIGKNLKGHYGVYVSLDAGFTWRQTLRDLYLFNMGDHGGIFTAVNYYRTNRETRHVLYSADEGRNWNQTKFHDEQIRLYGLMTEPGENTTTFTMFGSLPEKHQWIIVKLDFKSALGEACKDEDYKPWSPSQSEEGRSYVPCLMGQQMTYKRRNPNSKCYNGEDFQGPLKTVPCDCDALDFECDYGFIRLNTSPPRCVHNSSMPEHDPYKPNTCKAGQYYNRTKGYRKIAGDMCMDGFEDHYLPDQVPCPVEDMNAFLLFAQRERITRFDLVNKRVEELPVKNLKNVIAIDFDIGNQCVYWADIIQDVIGRQCLKGTTTPEILVSSELSSIEGMALDWLSHTLYFVDGVRAKIEFIRTDLSHSGRMRTTVLGSPVLRKPRGIAVHPQAGYLFWTDWSADYPSVSRANLDGSSNRTLFGKSTVIWPNGITVDYIANRIYWVDAKLDYIGSSDLHGDAFHRVVNKEEVVAHPFGIAVFKHQMYWDDWKRNSIFSADKDNYTGVEVLLKPLTGLMDLKVYAHGVQFGSNACTNTTDCKYTCVGLPKNNKRCLCPDGLQDVNGTCLCPGQVQPINNTCPKVNRTCSPEYFACSDGIKCVPKGWRCDGEDDCGDGSDELRCTTNTCAKNHFLCDNGKCLPHYWRCDFETDCSDGSDERDCPPQKCNATQFKCTNGRCISAKWKCDGQNDCIDGSDEVNCNPNPPSKTCKSDEFQCLSGGVLCIPSTWKCDGDPDCRDGSDELNCSNNTCADQLLSCGPPKFSCIYRSWICDGDMDCDDGRDEANCTSTSIKPLPPVGNFNTTDGYCEDWMFKCRNERCIPFWWKCDHANDCGDNSDEVGCSTTTTVPNTTISTTTSPQVVTCEKNMFQCQSGSCIFAGWVCDGSKDCPDGEDEHNCDQLNACDSTQFRCKQDGSCVHQSALCDGVKDCPDGTDEDSCNVPLPPVNPATPSCGYGFFPCDGTCFPLHLLCDTSVDCKDGFDERNCSSSKRIYQVQHIGADERGIGDTSISIQWWIQSPSDIQLEFIPSITADNKKWFNQSATEDTEYNFTGLQAWTQYNITIYVRIKSTGLVFPPAKYFIVRTVQSTPSVPFNLTVKQQNASHLLLSWTEPLEPKGLLQNYKICWYQDEQHVTTLQTPDNTTQFLLQVSMIHGQGYTFYVTARNSKFESPRSNIVTINYDGETELGPVSNLQYKDVDGKLQWTYDGKRPDSFSVVTRVSGFDDRSYPRLPVQETKQDFVTLKLSPGVSHDVQVYAHTNGMNGPSSFLNIPAQGVKLPEIDGLTVKSLSSKVNLTWHKPQSQQDIKWKYGVYYGTTIEDMFGQPKYETDIEKASIVNLQPCQVYIFSVGIIGPKGVGPISGRLINVITPGDEQAPPIDLKISPASDDHRTVKVEWRPGCNLRNNSNSPSYLVEFTELTKNRKWTSEVSGLWHVFKVATGAHYTVKVRTKHDKSRFSPAISFDGPQIAPPAELKVFSAGNGSFIIDWRELSGHKEQGKFAYEVLVTKGDNFNETMSEKYTVTKPPLVYSNTSEGDVYTFAVRVKTEKGMLSARTGTISRRSDGTATQPILGTTTGTVLGVLVVLVLISAVVWLAVRNRKLRNSFTRFANSHYDTRSQAATFDDSNSLEDDDCPQIRDRFSDDEPLVIA